jgi:5'-3' exonuclease, N-terminal resolvase-like domain
MRLIDGNNLLHRSLEVQGYGIHPVRKLYSEFCSPRDTTIIVWDGPYANKRRKEIYEGYKDNRRPKEESKMAFFDVAKGVLRFTPVIQVECVGWEADDVIGTLIDRYHGKHKLIVETNDGDYWQHKDKCVLPLVSKKWHGFSAQDSILNKCLVGDRKDGIPGIKGFGEKSWEMLSPHSRSLLRAAIKTNNFYNFEAVPDWPPKVQRTPEMFELLKLYWKLKEYWPVPHKEIDDVVFSGKLNIPAAEIFMEGYLI